MILKTKINKKLLTITLTFTLLILCLNCSEDKSVNIDINGETGTVTDIEGNVYQTIAIGNQWWMAENLKVTHYLNGDSVPYVTNYSEWKELLTGAYCNYDNSNSNAEMYGRLYNWYAVNDNRNIAPAGWHVASDEDWKLLEIYLGMDHSNANDYGLRGTNEGSKLADNTLLWNDGDLVNNAAFGKSGFSALPGGYRDFLSSDAYKEMSYEAYFWSSTESTSDDAAWFRTLYNISSCVDRNQCSKLYGFSVRCVKD